MKDIAVQLLLYLLVLAVGFVAGRLRRRTHFNAMVEREKERYARGQGKTSIDAEAFRMTDTAKFMAVSVHHGHIGITQRPARLRP